ncbi:MAG: GNAT family N-acetyltransferase [Thermomicrobiales bacterium]
MGTVQVRPARTKADIDAWITLPRRHLYAPSSPWVPPLDGDLRRMLDTHANPFFRHGEATPFLALDAHSEPVGRVLAHLYHRHNVRYAERAAFFGYFECRDDVATARALIGAAREFGARHGCAVLRGPFNMTAMQEMGILTEGFDNPPVVDEVYTAPSYPSLLEATGLRPTFPVTTYRVDDLTHTDPDALLTGRHRALLAGGRLRIRPAEMKHYDREIETLRELLNDSFNENPHFVPITADEFRFQIGPFKRVMDPAISLVAEMDGVPVAFCVTLPDFNPLLKQMNGTMGPREIATFLTGKSRVRDAVIVIIGVQRQLQGQGIMRVLQAELVRALRRRHYRTLTITWIADVNDKSRATAVALGGRPWHRLTLYEGPIGRGGEPETYPAWLDGARIAPSAHNTQPWRFAPLADGHIVVRWDPARTLPVSDPTSRDLYLGLGAAVESARLRAAGAGVSLAFAVREGNSTQRSSPLPHGGGAGALWAAGGGGQSRTIGSLIPSPDPISDADRTLAQSLAIRHTARTPHLDRPVPPEVIAAMRAEAARWGCKLHVVTYAKAIRRLAALARRATADQFADDTVQSELWQWLRLDPTDPAYERDGLTADCLNLHGATLAAARLTMPPARMRRLARLQIHHLLAIDTQQVVRRSAALCLLTAPSSERGALVETGRALLRLWLIAAGAGLTTHPVSALLDCAATIDPTVALFGATREPPAALFRLGFTPPVHRAPRLPADELLEMP